MPQVRLQAVPFDACRSPHLDRRGEGQHGQPAIVLVGKGTGRPAIAIERRAAARCVGFARARPTWRRTLEEAKVTRLERRTRLRGGTPVVPVVEAADARPSHNFCFSVSAPRHRPPRGRRLPKSQVGAVVVVVRDVLAEKATQMQLAEHDDVVQLRWMDNGDVEQLRQVGLGTFDKLLFEHLNAIADLGVNAIELLPIQDSADTLNWGYGTRFSSSCCSGTTKEPLHACSWRNRLGNYVAAVASDLVPSLRTSYSATLT